MTSRAVAILLMLIATTLPIVAQKPVKEEPIWLDGSQPPPAISDMVAEAGVVIVAVYTGNQRLHPDMRPTSLVSTLHKFEIVEVIKSAPAVLKAGTVIEVEMFGGIVELPTETHHARVQGEERLIPKRRYVLFLNYLPTRSVGNYVRAWGGAGEGIYDITGERVRPLNTTRREHRGKPASEFLGELRQFK